MTENFLTLPHTITGKVIHGEKVGRTIGFPTANLDVELSENQLKAGAYFGRCYINNQMFYCLPYFGPRLIFGETQNIFEVYIYDLNQEIYGQVIKVEVLELIHTPKKVTSIEELQTLLENDKQNGLELLKKL